jgi:hypothetical protein
MSTPARERPGTLTAPLTRRLRTLKSEAQRIGKRREFLMDLVNRGKLDAWKYGTADHPVFMVLPEDVDAAIERERKYVPPARVRRPNRPEQTKTLNPLVKC